MNGCKEKQKRQKSLIILNRRTKGGRMEEQNEKKNL